MSRQRIIDAAVKVAIFSKTHAWAADPIVEDARKLIQFIKTAPLAEVEQLLRDAGVKLPRKRRKK